MPVEAVQATCTVLPLTAGTLTAVGAASVAVMALPLPDPVATQYAEATPPPSATSTAIAVTIAQRARGSRRFMRSPWLRWPNT